MRGDRVLVIVDVGGGTSREFEVVADANGRTVEVTTARGGMLEVSVMTRTGRPVRTNRFMASRVVALIEDKQEEEAPPEEAPRLPIIEHATKTDGVAALARARAVAEFQRAPEGSEII